MRTPSYGSAAMDSATWQDAFGACHQRMVPLTISATGDSRPTMQIKESSIYVLTLNGAHVVCPYRHGGTVNLSKEYKP